jgi:negative regulator of flagellin synthesis FlgM
MRIGGFNQITQIYQNSTNKQSGSASRPGFSDALQISGAGQDYQIAKNALKSVPDVREDVVSAIRAQLADGSYHVSNNALADKLLSETEDFTL